MKAALTILSVCVLVLLVSLHVRRQQAERAIQLTAEVTAALQTHTEAGLESRSPVRPGTNTAPSAPKPIPTSLAALPPTEQRSLEDQMRAAQRWFAFAGNTSNGSPRLVASVRGQKFDFVAEDSGVSVRPWKDATNWSWRMASGDAANVTPKAEKERATYARGAGVTEWFENGASGVEQGFTLDTANGEAVRRMPLRVMTELRPKLRPSADGVDFMDANGEAQLHYDGLHAFDAAGRKLKSWMEVSSEDSIHSLALAVDTTGATFPVTIDPLISLATERIRHPEPVQGDLFGVTVAAYGNLIALGAPKHQVGAVPDAGVVYLFIRDNNCDEEWTLLQKIQSPNPYNNGQFGRALSIGNGALAVSAHRLGLVNGGDVLEDVVHVFQPSPTNSSVWTRRATVKDPDPNATPTPTNYFGHSISVNAQGTRMAVGSPLAWSEGGQFPFRTGEVFLYGRDIGGAENWGVIHTYQPPLFVPNARFGRSVALDGERLAVGAPGYFSHPPDTNGSVFVIETNPSAQGPSRDELPAPVVAGPNALRGFGERVALSGNQLAVAAADSDALVVYERRVTYPAGVASVQWTHGLLNSTTLPFVIPGSKFAQAISLSQGTLLVSHQTLEYAGEDFENDEPLFVRVDSLVRFEHQGDAGGNPALNWKREADSPVEAFNLRGIANVVIAGNLTVITSTNETLGGLGSNFGIAVAMRRQGGTWAATQRFVAGPPLASNDLAGTSIAVSDDLLVVGAPGHDVGGVANSGAVHIFRRLSGFKTNVAATAIHGWTLAATLVNDTPQENGRLGESVAVKDGLVIAGAPGRNNNGGTVWIWKRASEAADVWAGHVVLGAPSGAPGWKFGSAVSFNGSTIAVGSPFAGAGRAHLFRRGNTNDWPVLQTLLPHTSDGRFGAALDLDEDDNLIVGSPDASVNGAQSGEAYIYGRSETASGPEWVEEADPGSFVPGGHAGSSVAIDRGWAFVGAPGEVIGSGRSGRVRVFARNNVPGNLWEPVTTLEAPASINGTAQFGSAIALDEHHAVIGAPGGTNTGAAFVYSRVPGGTGNWRYTAKLLDCCNEASDRFGSSIALDHDKIFVGSPRADLLSAGNAGTVTLFERQGATWTLQREVPDDSTHRIGSAVSVSGDWMVIGSTRDWDGVTEGPSDAGQVYVLRRHDGANGSWNVVQRVVRPNFGSYDADVDDFGQAVGISGRVFVAGSTVGAYTFELAADGQVSYLGRLRAGTDDIEFGRAVAIHGQRIAVTALNSVAFFVRTNEHTEPFGEVFIQTHWHREARQGVGYAESVDLSDTTAVVGSPGDISISGGVFGTVSVFDRDQGGPGHWGSTTYFSDPDVYGDENHLPAFGRSVSLDGDTLVVGTWYPGNQSGESGSGTIFQRHAGGFNQWGKVAEVGGPVVAVSGDWVASGYNMPPLEADETGDGSFMYVELRHRNAGGPDQWGVAQTFFAPNPSRTHTWNFGYAVALDGTTLVIGAPGEKRTAIDWTPGRAFIYDVPLNSLRIWKDTLFAEQYFTAPITTQSGQAAGNLGDIDNDGIPNAWEAYHGTSPFLADAALAGLKPQGLSLATGEFVVRWREAFDPQGLSVTLQWSRNVSQWFGSGAGPSVGDTKTFAITTVETHADHFIKEARLPAGTDTKLFTRLVLTGL